MASYQRVCGRGTAKCRQVDKRARHRLSSGLAVDCDCRATRCSHMADTDTPAPPTEPLVRLRLFGRLVAVRGGEELDLGSTKQRAILAALGLQAGVVVSTDALIDWVWPDGDFPGSPLTSIRSYVSNLRRILGNGGVQITSQAPG